jgi:hypothetical protein
MRTDGSMKPALLLLAGALLAGALPLPGQQETLVLDPAATVQPAPQQVRVLPATVRHGDHTVAADEMVDGSVVITRGDLHVHGRVKGDITVSGGNLVLYEGARVDGSAHVRGGTLRNEGAVVRGEMSATTADRAAPRGRRGAGATLIGRGWFGSVGAGMLGVVQTLALGLVLAGIGAALVFYALPQLREVSETVRHERWRATGVGLATNILAIPVFLMGMAALLITIIGIPLLLIYVPFFWVALFLAAAFGLVAVAHALGEHTIEKQGTYEARYRNAYAYTFVGLGLLLAPLLASHLIGMVGYLGFVGTLVGLFANLLLWLAGTVGAGAVLIVATRHWKTRRQRPRTPPAPGEPLRYADDVPPRGGYAGRTAGPEGQDSFEAGGQHG